MKHYVKLKHIIHSFTHNNDITELTDYNIILNFDHTIAFKVMETLFKDCLLNNDVPCTYKGMKLYPLLCNDDFATFIVDKDQFTNIDDYLKFKNSIVFSLENKNLITHSKKETG